MPTATLTTSPTTSAERASEQMHVLLAELNMELERMLRAELAKLPPQDRRLFRAELAPIDQRLERDDHSNEVRLVLVCDPPRIWMVEPGSDADDLTVEQATMLVKAGAGACRFDTDGDGDCHVALCDACHPEAWAS